MSANQRDLHKRSYRPKKSTDVRRRGAGDAVYLFANLRDMTLDYASPAAHQQIPDDFLECIMTRRHSWESRRRQHPQRVNFPIEGSRDPLETIEFYGDCTLCKTNRNLYRDRADDSFLWATYVYPAGYEPPAGQKWDREAVRQEYRRRFPVGGAVKTIKRGGR